MSRIEIKDIEVAYRIGVPDEERAEPQRLTVTVCMETPFAQAALSDSIDDTIDYFEVSERIKRFGEGKSWKLLEKLVVDMAQWIQRDFQPVRVSVEIKKYILRDTQYVSVFHVEGDHI